MATTAILGILVLKYNVVLWVVNTFIPAFFLTDKNGWIQGASLAYEQREKPETIVALVQRLLETDGADVISIRRVYLDEDPEAEKLSKIVKPLRKGQGLFGVEVDVAA